MGLMAADYLAQLKALLPPGQAWPRDASARLTQLLSAWSDELARVDGRVAQLLEEIDPRTTGELLPDWERVAALPAPCVDEAQTTSQRRATLHAKLTTLGGQNAAYFIALAESLGYTVTITEFHLHTVEDDVDYPLYATPWQFAWQVNAPQDNVGQLSVIDSVDDPLAWWGNETLECVINRLKPSHTHVLFAYS